MKRPDVDPMKVAGLFIAWLLVFAMAVLIVMLTAWAVVSIAQSL